MLKNVFTNEIGRIYRLKIPFEDLYTSVFLIKESVGNILIDCATTDRDVDDYIVPALFQTGLSISDIKYLILTHNHCDHAGGKERILQLNPKIRVINKKCDMQDGIEIYPMPGHMLDCIGVFDLRTNTLISGDGLQGYGVGKYRCSLESKTEYLKTIEKIKNDKRIKNILFSHAYEPWFKNGVFGREMVEKSLQDCKNCCGELA